MTQRALGLLASLMGMAVVVMLVLLGIDAWQAARTGPRWKRRLVSAGLILLAMLGVAGCDTQADPPKDPAPETKAGRRAELHETFAWEQLTTIWRNAAEVSSGKRGAYPFNQAGKTKMLADLKQATEIVDKLQTQGLLTQAESGLLKKELLALTKGVNAKRPTEMKRATCYEPMWIPPAAELSAKRLTERLPLLKQMAEAKTVKAAVLEKVIGTVRADIATLRDPEKMKQLNDKTNCTPAQARKTLKEAEEVLEKIEAKLHKPAVDLPMTKEWQQMTTVCHEASEVSSGRRGPYPFDKAGKQELLADIKTASKNIALLHSKGILGESEAGLLQSDLEDLTHGVQAKRVKLPKGQRMTCYRMAFTPPAQKSLADLTKRLPMLEKMATSKTINPEVAAKVLESIEKDIAVLTDPKATKQLRNKADIRKANEMRQKAAKTVELLKARLDAKDGGR
jgi:hypothetical protein